MYEKFSYRARKVMQLANNEARRFNHEYIGTEHIIIGLCVEGSGIAAMALKNLGVDLGRVKIEVEQLIQFGPEMVTMGKLPQTPRSKRVIELAMEEARRLRHNHVGTEHLLIGLCVEEEGVASQVLKNFGVTADVAREAVLRLTPRIEGTENKTGLGCPNRHRQHESGGKSAVESARCIVTAIAGLRCTGRQIDEDEIAVYESAIGLLARQINECLDLD